MLSPYVYTLDIFPIHCCTVLVLIDANIAYSMGGEEREIVMQNMSASIWVIENEGNTVKINASQLQRIGPMDDCA